MFTKRFFGSLSFVALCGGCTIINEYGDVVQPTGGGAGQAGATGSGGESSTPPGSGGMGVSGGRGGSGGTSAGTAGLGGNAAIGGHAGGARGGTAALGGVGGQNVGGSTSGGAANTGGMLQQGGLGGAQHEGGISGATPGGAAGQDAGGATQSGIGGSIAGAGTAGGTGGAGFGGTASGGTETGGTLTAGAPTAGAASGGAATGGTATAGTAPHVFVGGPCIVSPEQATTNDYVYARGDDQRIHRAIVTSAGSSSGWAAVPGLDASVLAQGVDDDLDCHASIDVTMITHIVAMSSMPSGSVRHTSGSDLTFSAFAQVDLGSTYDRGPSVANFDSAGGYYLGLKDLPSTGTTGFTLAEVSRDGVATNTSSKAQITASLTSGIDSASYAASSFGDVRFVAFDANGQLQLMIYQIATGSTWGAPTYFDPPIGHTFQHSPSVCIARNHWVETTENPHLVVTAGNRLWHAVRAVSGTWGAWQQAANADIASSPDCVVAEDQTIGIVATTTQGSIVYVHGTTDGALTTFTELDLGRMDG